MVWGASNFYVQQNLQQCLQTVSAVSVPLPETWCLKVGRVERVIKHSTWLGTLKPIWSQLTVLSKVSVCTPTTVSGGCIYPVWGQKYLVLIFHSLCICREENSEILFENELLSLVLRVRVFSSYGLFVFIKEIWGKYATLSCISVVVFCRG